MRQIRHILAFVFVVVCVIAKAQQAPMFTNYSNSYATVNPGFGGLSEGINVMSEGPQRDGREDRN